ncbi:App1 family protein [Bifidobacterium avesanii]|uniref:DUF2183 domain-containing protein n=1 Tax=Bifidobacterium avesanii TaxID=1798157 RepID=A0A7K3THJ4_9BIFI|nr:phosphatase domain-containing protein [Bifidobacterium avesanii]KAB8292604.1 ABC transporter ATP-binding protein [Bifidobacterium avesanii]NEG78568.1 DUF2183 domain-containing protein [Bifidobacterium avesanii]
MSNREAKQKPIRARRTTTIVDAASWRERIENKPIVVRATRRVVTHGFGVWSALSTLFTKQLGWYPRVEPYVGYGTEAYSRLICRTVRAPERREAGVLMRGIRGMLTVPAPHTHVRITVDRRPLETVQIGTSEAYDPIDPSRDQPSSFAISDDAGYLDLVAEHHMTPGIHQVSYSVERRPDVTAPLFTIPSEAQVGIISDVDDTIMVTQAPTLWKAAYNLLFLNPRKRAVVPGMNVLYSKIADLFPDAPFFYLSTSPWNVETSIRHFIRYQGYPEGPLLLRDLDPRPKTFIPSGVQHKLEFAEQLMADFPRMRFILIGDDGQKDPTTYATIAKRYPGRVICIGIRQLTPKEASVVPAMQIAGMTTTQPIPVTDVPVFTGTTGSNLMKTMLPYLRHNV